MSATTPLPWITSDDPDEKPQPLYRGIIAYMGKDENGEHHMVWTRNNEYTPYDCMQANAELIVKAVNAHDALTESHARLAHVLREVLLLDATIHNALLAAQAVAFDPVGHAQYDKLAPQIKAALASIPTESALKEAHDG
jgi:hypothetical protein